MEQQNHRQEEEEKERQNLGHHISRKLNFNAPLLTTRRPPSDPTELKFDRKVSSTIDRVPFSWEQAPGKPKECTNSAVQDDAATPRPSLPPSWWRPTNQHRQREGDNDDDSNRYVISDSVEVFSLSEAIDIVEKAEKDHNFTEELRIKFEEEEEEERRKNYTQSSNFMIERFLPDATALAAASTLKCHDYYSCSYRNRECVSPQAVGRGKFSPPKGCGLDVLFPWRTKQHQLCGVKSPVRHGSLSLGSKSSAKHKKHN